MQRLIIIAILLCASLAQASNFPLERKAGQFDTDGGGSGYGCLKAQHASAGPAASWETVTCGLSEDYFIVRFMKLPSDAISWKFKHEGYRTGVGDGESVCYEVRAVAIPPGTDVSVTGFPITMTPLATIPPLVLDSGEVLYRSDWSDAVAIRDGATGSTCVTTACDYSEVNVAFLRVECASDDLGVSGGLHRIRRVLADPNP